MGVLGDAVRIVVYTFMSGSFFDHVKGIRQQFEHMPWEKRKEILDGWVELLTRYRWDVFATLTWRNPTSAEVIIKNLKWWLWNWQLETAIKRGLAWLDDECKARGPWANAYRRGRRRPVWVIGIEPHKSGRLHAHAMIQWDDGLNDLNRQHGWRIWHSAYGRARIEPPRSQEDVAEYCSKYVVKDGDVTLSPSFKAARMVDDSDRHPLT